MIEPRPSFGSDNHAGVHPEVLEAIGAANVGAVPAYGDDPWTERARELFASHFGEQARAYPVFNGTGANVLSFAALCRPHHAVICTEMAHINVDECGAPERVGGVKLVTVPTPDGKLTPELIDSRAHGFGDQHHVQPRVVSITQSTELGTLYTPEELAAVAACAHGHGMYLHIDGARLANAAAALDVPLRAISTDVGADVVSFGGTKNGLLAGEAVVFLREGLDEEFLFARKGSMQLASKMRFLSAQLIALLEGDLWLRNARHANAMGARLAGALREIGGVRLTQEPQVNAIFAVIAPEATERLQREFPFYVWDERTGEVRWMTSWATTPESVDRFAAAIAQAVGG